MRPIPLRVGICACSDRYKGKLAKQEFAAHGKRFHLREISVPAGYHEDVLEQKRCHAFLDVHFFGGRPHVTIELEDMPFLFFQGTVWKSWHGRRPPDRESVIKGLQRLIKALPRPTLQLWLQRMRLQRTKKT